MESRASLWTLCFGRPPTEAHEEANKRLQRIESLCTDMSTRMEEERSIAQQSREKRYAEKRVAKEGKANEKRAAKERRATEKRQTRVERKHKEHDTLANAVADGVVTRQRKEAAAIWSDS